MRQFPSALSAFLGERRGRFARLLVWIEAKNRDTGAPETLGFWTGEDHQIFTLAGVERTYYGAGALVAIDPLTSDIGLTVRQTRLVFSGIAPELVQLVRGYDPRLAPVEIHVVDFDPETHIQVAEPQRVFRGWIDAAPIEEGELGGDSVCEMTLLSSAQSLTRRLARKRSDQSLRARAGGDGFRRYADISGSVETPWGEKAGKRPETGGGA